MEGVRDDIAIFNDRGGGRRLVVHGDFARFEGRSLYTKSSVTTQKESLKQAKKTNIILGLPIPKLGRKNIYQFSIAPSLLAKRIVGMVVRMNSAEAAFKVIRAIRWVRCDYWRFSFRLPLLVDIIALLFGNRVRVCGWSHIYTLSVGEIFLVC